MDNKDQLIGKTLGQYELLEYLGYGAMARVYRSQHTVLRRLAAVKVLHTHYADDFDFVTQFKSEARNLASLRHPNIVQVYDFNIQDEYPFMVMEYIVGTTLKATIEKTKRERSRLPIARSLRIIYSLALALSYAHQRNIIHRDIKPSNVMIEKSGRVVLTDFGLARLMTAQRETLTGTIKGTPAYMSPEQAMGRPSNQRSDIYSLGVMLFELITGQLPFDDENPFAIAMKHVNEPTPSPRSLFPEMPIELERVILSSMVKNPNNRYPNINAFIEDLTKVRLKIRTAKLPTAALSALDLDDQDLWNAPERPSKEDMVRVCLNFVDTGQILNLFEIQEYTIGRKTQSQPVVPDIDLTPYDAHKWGISRLHASISVQNDKITLTDLGSSNGSRISGVKLDSNKPYELHHADVVHLGRLQIQILIYE